MVSEPGAWEDGESTAPALIIHNSRLQSSQMGQTLLYKMYKTDDSEAEVGCPWLEEHPTLTIRDVTFISGSQQHNSGPSLHNGIKSQSVGKKNPNGDREGLTQPLK